MAVQHLIDICKQLRKMGNSLLDLQAGTGQGRTVHNPEFDALYQALVEDLSELSSADFPPDKRIEFIKFRKFLQNALPEPRTLTKITDDRLAWIDEMQKLLASFGDDGSRSSTRDFTFIKDADLRKIIARDYRELKVILFPSGAWKSSVVLAGSILEAILFDTLTSDVAKLAQANAAKKAPCNRTKSPKPALPSDEWTLENLIDVAEEIGALPAQHAKCIDQVLRGYRNFYTRDVRFVLSMSVVSHKPF